MGELIDANSASVPTASVGGDASQQREIVPRGNHACGSKVGTCSEELVDHKSVSKRVGYGGVEAWWESCTYHVRRTKAGTLVGTSN